MGEGTYWIYGLYYEIIKRKVSQMYKYLIKSNGLIYKIEVGEHFKGQFVVLDHFPTEQEYFDILDGFMVDAF